MNTELPAGYCRPRVKLTGRDGNACNVLGLVSRAIRQAGNSQEMVDAFLAEAKAGDYNHLLAACMRWADVE